MRIPLIDLPILFGTSSLILRISQQESSLMNYFSKYPQKKDQQLDNTITDLMLHL